MLSRINVNRLPILAYLYDMRIREYVLMKSGDSDGPRAPADKEELCSSQARVFGVGARARASGKGENHGRMRGRGPRVDVILLSPCLKGLILFYFAPLMRYRHSSRVISSITWRQWQPHRICAARTRTPPPHVLNVTRSYWIYGLSLRPGRSPPSPSLPSCG